MSEMIENQQERQSIMILNDDCLCNIIAMLNILDLMQLKRVNKRLNDLVQFSGCKELNLTVFPGTLKNWQFRKMVNLCSLLLTSMEVPIQRNLPIERILNVVKKCGKLQSLKVIHGKSFDDRMIQIQQALQIGKRISCSVVRLDLCVEVFCLNDIFKAFPNLEDLRCRSVIKENHILRETTLRNNIKSLEIYAHSTRQCIPLNLVPSLPMLEKFHLACKGAKVLDCPFPDRTLWFTNFFGLKKLKEIHIKHWGLNDLDLMILGLSICGQLETLGFHECCNITEAGFRRFLRTQPTLKTVDIRCVNIRHQLFTARCLNHYIETRPVKEPLNVITNCNTSQLSPRLNIVQASNRFECAHCERR